MIPDLEKIKEGYLQLAELLHQDIHDGESFHTCFFEALSRLPELKKLDFETIDDVLAHEGKSLSLQVSWGHNLPQLISALQERFTRFYPLCDLSFLNLESGIGTTKNIDRDILLDIDAQLKDRGFQLGIIDTRTPMLTLVLLKSSDRFAVSYATSFTGYRFFEIE